MKITIGGFDGMHLAHLELIKRADAYLVIEKNSNLTPTFDRLEYSSKLLDILFLKDIKNLTPIKFIEILKKYKAKEIVIGEDFRFGKDRKGDIQLLKKYFKVEVIEEIKLNNTPIHSNTIKQLILKKQIKKANQFLSHNYKIKGIKIKGQGLGKQLVPTINIKPIKNYLLPQGVFVTKTNGCDSITFIGVRSTDNNFSIETHILEDFKEDNLFAIEFLFFLRDNKKFESILSLKKQILTDIQKAKSYLKELKKTVKY